MIFYLCNGKAPCKDEVGCGYHDKNVDLCWHASDSSFALNGPCDEPDNNPDRFEKYLSQRKDGVIDYWEREGKEET